MITGYWGSLLGAAVGIVGVYWTARYEAHISGANEHRQERERIRAALQGVVRFGSFEAMRMAPLLSAALSYARFRHADGTAPNGDHPQNDPLLMPVLQDIEWQRTALHLPRPDGVNLAALPSPLAIGLHIRIGLLLESVERVKVGPPGGVPGQFEERRARALSDAVYAQAIGMSLTGLMDEAVDASRGLGGPVLIAKHAEVDEFYTLVADLGAALKALKA